MHALIAPFALLLLAAPSVPAARGELYVLAINGGGDRLDNFASHLAHLHQLVALLGAAGVPKDHITVLASDGSNPAPDLATREPDPEHAWLLQGTHVDPLLRDLTTFASSSLPGVDLRPATSAGLARAIAELGGRLRAGDTLLLYVTDHGTQSRRDPTGNRITLWGPRESISVSRLGALLGRLPPGVRVVALMSQCYSGGFAYLHEAREHRRRPSGATCGYFSSTPDRPSYGCYPEVRSQKAIGHSFEFLSALARNGRFSSAHTAVLIGDDTPDIPLRSSDVYLAELVGRHAPSDAGLPAFVDSLVAPALAQGGYADEKRLLDAIAARFAIPRPASLAELEQRIDHLFALLERIDAQTRVWETALADFNQAALEGFLAAYPDRRASLHHSALRRLSPAERQARATTFLRELFAFVSSDAEQLTRARRLTTGLSQTDEVAYRTEIRVAALLRMRFIFTAIAGHEWSRRQPAEAAAVAALEQCEALDLPVPTRAPLTTRDPPAPKLPPLERDERLATEHRPGWIGITYVPVSPGRRARLRVGTGAVTVTAVVPRSPAALAGLRPGDIVEGAAGRPFARVHELRPTIAAAAPGSQLALTVVRGAIRRVVTTQVGEIPAQKR